MPKGQEKGTSSAKANASSATGQAKASTESVPTATANELLQAIQSLKTELKEDNENLRKDINTLHRELSSKLDDINEDVKALAGRMEEAESRVEQVENMTLELTEALFESITRQRRILNKLTDLESRSRRNNVRIFGVGEGDEGKSVPQFITDMLLRELPLPDGLELKIQRAHRVPAHKPRSGDPPRPILVSFQEFTTKELILREAWRKKKVQLNGKIIYFDHDYATEIVQKRKKYKEIKRALKESGVRFQTPYTSMRIHWQDGVGHYGSAHEAGLELRNRGYNVEIPATEEEDKLLRKSREWQRSARPRRSTSTAQRVKERLREFQRSED